MNILRNDGIHEKPLEYANLNQLVPFLMQINLFLFHYDTLLTVMAHFFGVVLPKRQKEKQSFP